MTDVTVKLSFTLPWWWRLYFGGALVWAWLGLPINPERAMRFLGDHCKIAAT